MAAVKTSEISFNSAFPRSRRPLLRGKKEKEMLPYQEDAKLEILLEELFSDDDELTADGVGVLSKSIDPMLLLSSDCCRYSYTGY